MIANNILKELCPMAGSTVPSAKRREKETRRSDIRKSYSWEKSWWWFCVGYFAAKGMRETMLRAPAFPMQLKVLFGAGVICKDAHSSEWLGMVPTVNVCGFPVVISSEVPCSLLRMPFKLSSFVLSKVAGKLKLTKRPAVTDWPCNVVSLASVRVAVAVGELLKNGAITALAGPPTSSRPEPFAFVTVPRSL